MGELFLVDEHLILIAFLIRKAGKKLIVFGLLESSPADIEIQGSLVEKTGIVGFAGHGCLAS